MSSQAQFKLIFVWEFMFGSLPVTLIAGYSQASRIFVNVHLDQSSLPSMENWQSLSLKLKKRTAAAAREAKVVR